MDVSSSRPSVLAAGTKSPERTHNTGREGREIAGAKNENPETLAWIGCGKGKREKKKGKKEAEMC